MNLETSIKDIITKKLEEGIVEGLIAEKLEKGIANALDDLMGYYGGVTKVIEEQVKSVMIPHLESYDYSKYIAKLDAVLVDVLESSALENKKLLENFKNILIPEERKEIKVSELYKIWQKYASKNVDTYNLEIDYDDEPSYQYLKTSLEVERVEEKPWDDWSYAVLTFECEQDDELNFQIKLSNHRKYDNKWSIDRRGSYDLNSLRFLNDFEVTLMKLSQAETKVILDTEWENDDEVEVEAEPEATFS